MITPSQTHSGQPEPKRMATLIALMYTSLSLVGCGTLTGIPAHGGGKRYAEEQRLVSASIRSALKDIDVTPLRGHKIAIVFDIVADEGGGTMSGGRLNILGAATSGYLMSPVTSSSSAFQVFNLLDSNTNYANTGMIGNNSASTSYVSATTGTGNGSYTSSGTGTSTQTSTANSSQTNNGTSTYNQTGSGTNNNTSTGSSTNANTGTNSTSSSGTNSNTGTGSFSQTQSGTSSTNTGMTGSSSNSSTVTGATPATTSATTGTSAYTQAETATGTTGGSSSGTNANSSTGSFSQTQSSSDASTSSGSSSQTQSGTNTSTANGSSANSSTGNSSQTANANGSSTQTGKGSNASNSQSNQNSNSNNNGVFNQNNAQTGGYITAHQTVSQAPSSETKQTKGHQVNIAGTLDYKGLGEYQNFNVPKSDATLLMGLVRNYLLFSGAEVTTPTDPSADVLLYVTVDVFGIVRSRFDSYIYNQETLKAETSFEMAAFDRSGRMVMRPRTSDHEAQYAERYLFWAGPFRSDERVKKGQGLLVDFTDVDGLHTSYGSKQIDKTFPFGKN